MTRTDEIDSAVRRSVLSGFVKRPEVEEDAARVVLRSSPSATYFQTGDKAMKVRTIEVVRWFRDLPWLQELRLTILPVNPQSHIYTRERIESAIGSSLEGMTGVKWQMFLARHDHYDGRRELFDKITEGRTATAADEALHPGEKPTSHD